MLAAITALFRSRKFLLLLLAFVTTVIFHYIPNFPAEIWQALDAVIVAVIIGIAVEDAAEKAANPLAATDDKAHE